MSSEDRRRLASLAHRLARLQRVAAPSPAISSIFEQFVKKEELFRTKKEHPDMEPVLSAVEKKLLSELDKLPAHVILGLQQLGALAKLGSSTMLTRAMNAAMREGLDMVANMLGVRVPGHTPWPKVARLKRVAGPTPTAEKIKHFEGLERVTQNLIKALKSRDQPTEAFAALVKKVGELTSDLQKAEDQIQRAYKMIDEAEVAAEEAEDKAVGEVQDFFRRSVRPKWLETAATYSRPLDDQDMATVMRQFMTFITKFVPEREIWD